MLLHIPGLWVCLCFLGPPARQCVAPEDNDALDQRPAPRNVVDVDDDEQDEEEAERDEGGEGEEEQEEEEGEGERRFCLGQEHDSRAVREREGSEWPWDAAF